MDWRETPAEVERAGAERPVVMPGPHGKLFGIFTPPAAEAPPTGMCVVLPGRTRWSWRSRLSVRSARRLAGAGFGCLRFDYHGYGESEGTGLKVHANRPYGEDVVAAIRYLRETLGQQRFVLFGFCFSARSALAAFVEEGDAIEGLVFVSAPLMEERGYWGWSYVLRALKDPVKIRAFLRSRKDWPRTAAMLAKALGRSVAGGPEERRFPFSQSFKEHFGALVRSRARALFLYGLEDRQYQEFRLAQGLLFAKLDPETRRRFEIEFWPGRMHAPVDTHRQQEVFERAESWIKALRPEYASTRKSGADASAYSN